MQQGPVTYLQRVRTIVTLVNRERRTCGLPRLHAPSTWRLITWTRPRSARSIRRTTAPSRWRRMALASTFRSICAPTWTSSRPATRADRRLRSAYHGRQSERVLRGRCVPERHRFDRRHRRNERDGARARAGDWCADARRPRRHGFVAKRRKAKWCPEQSKGPREPWHRSG